MRRALRLLPVVLLLGCGSSDPPPAGGTGGRTGSGGAGSGGAGTGGSAGSGGATPDTGASETAPPEVAPETAPPDASPESYLDQCFAGLRPFATRGQVAHKQSSNGAYQIRIALEVNPDGLGTSGTIVWRAIRLGVVIPNRRVCLDEAALANTYVGSRHNCMDALTVTSGGLTYKLQYPDTDPARPATILSITGEGATLPTMLPTTRCETRPGGEMCKSGAPCN